MHALFAANLALLCLFLPSRCSSIPSICPRFLFSFSRDGTSAASGGVLGPAVEIEEVPDRLLVELETPQPRFSRHFSKLQIAFD
jgi:hypothetical protein